jgi:manganese/iron transport system permease protein
MLIAPGAIAFLLARTFSRMLAVSVLVAVASSFLGVYASFFIDSAPAPTIVLLMTIFFLAAFVRATRRAARTRLREAAITEA